MARVYIIADSGRDPALAAMYRPAWHIIPDLAVDLVGPSLIRIMSVSVVERLLLAFAIVICLVGTIAFHRATFERRSYWPLAVGLILYNGEFLLGFINFSIGTGAALLAGAAAVSKTHMLKALRVPLSCVAAVIVFFCHVWPLLFYFILLGAQEARGLYSDTRPIRAINLIRSSVRLGVPAILPLLFLMFLTPRSTVVGPILWGGIKARVNMAASPFINYNPILDGASLLLVLGMIGVLVSRKALLMPLPTVLTLALLGLIFMLCPFGVAGAYFLNARLALFMTFMLFAGTCPRVSSSVSWSIPAAVITILLVTRVAVINDVWRSSRHDIADFHGLGTSLPAGSRVLATLVSPDEDRARYFRDQPPSRQLRGMLPNFWYLPSLWVIERKAFFPLIFTNPALQPLEVSEKYRRLSVPFGVPPDYRTLFNHELAARELKHSPYLADWEKNFDYVVVLSAGRAEHLDGLNTLPLALVGRTDIAALYKILR